MRAALIAAAPLLAPLLAPEAQAAEVVWLGAPAPEDQARVGALAGAQGPALSPLELLAAPTAFDADDEAAWARLDATLTAVRAFETRLDGETLIIRDLGPAIAGIGLLRDEADRARLRSALAYQGFAVHRLAQDDLGTHADFAELRAELGGKAHVAAWVDAAALDPGYAITPYDIAEAPERVAYTVTAKAVAGALPATLSVGALPEGHKLFVDGAELRPDATGLLRLPPGRHLAHLVRDGVIVARYDLRLAPAEAATLSLPELKPAEAALSALAEGPLPEPLAAAVEALGGEVWVAQKSGSKVEVFALTADQVREVELPRAGQPSSGGSEGLQLAAIVGGGWLWSGDFLASHPGAPATYATVNAAAPQLAVEVAWRKGPLAADLGLGLAVPLGAEHTARTGDREQRLRPAPTLAFGHPYARVTAGFLFPHHPIFGLRGELPLGDGPLSIRADAMVGPGLTYTRDDDTTWESFGVRGASVGLRWAFGG